MEIFICDDNMEELETSENFVREICGEMGRKVEIHTFSSPDELLEYNVKPDIAVLDIVMEGKNGITLGAMLKEKHPKLSIIYTSSFEDYVMSAINKVHARSYLCKPIDKEELKKQLEDIFASFPKSGHVKTYYDLCDRNMNPLPSVTLASDDILYINCVKNQRKVEIVTEEAIYRTETLFEVFSDEYEKLEFVITCRGTLVNLKHVVNIKGYFVCVDNGDRLPISQKRRSELKMIINRFLHNEG